MAMPRRASIMFLCLLCLLWAGDAACAPSGMKRPFSHYADQQPLATVLMSFAEGQGLKGSCSPAIKGNISGRFTEVPPDDFLGAMHAAYGVAWYRLGTTLHFYSAAESTSVYITPKTMKAATLRDNLALAGLFSPELPVRLSGDMIIVTGPPAYVNGVVGATQALESTLGSNIVMRVFPLKYAWADDITIESMGKSVTVPGVASILRAMLTGQADTAAGSTMRQEPATVGKLNGTGLTALGKESKADSEGGGSGSTGAATSPLPGGVNIIADPRVNAIVVSDAAYRMPHYAAVVTDLDKPVELVEIHAAIVDINVENTRELGVNYQGGYMPSGNGWGGGGEVGTGQSSFKPIPPAGSITTSGLSLSTIYTHGADYFLARVSALETTGDARVLGKPSVLTVDNVQASLENTTTYYVTIEGYQATDLYKVEAGTVLRVTPHIIRESDGRTVIKLAVNVQDAQNNNSNLTVSKAGAAPEPIKQTTINTQAIIGAGESLLIGGYYYEKTAEDVNGIPVLMHIPVIGHLFKTTTDTTRRMERLILITPKIVTSGNKAEMPERLNDPRFHRSATQSDYEERTPTPPAAGGCSRQKTGAASVPAPAPASTPGGGI